MTIQSDLLSSSPGDPATISLRGKTISVPRGTRICQLLDAHPHPEDASIIAAIADNMLVSLNARIHRSGKVEPVPICSPKGARLYQRHLTLMLYAVMTEHVPNASIQIGQAISEGHYFTVSGQTCDMRFLRFLTEKLNALAAAKKPFVYKRLTVGEARRLFSKTGESVKRHLLEQWASSHVSIVQIENYVDLCLSPVVPHTGYFDQFRLLPLEDNTFILQFPDFARGTLKPDTHLQTKLYATHKESKRRSQLLGVGHIAELNQAAISKNFKRLMNIAESQQEKDISSIADMIVNKKRRLVFIAGPSSAGKTTFSKRLSIQLTVAGISPRALSLDNYYVDRDKSPLDDQGKWDFEALNAIDLERFNTDLRRLLDGKDIVAPVYDFTTGTRKPADQGTPMILADNDVLIVEGIHGLNNALTPAISATEKFKIYVNALNPLAIDHQNRLNTSDVRLLRRIVRDRHYRGYSATQTINNWQSVRRGERLHIFPFQESADVIFDTSLIYEFSLLKIWAERYLLEVPRTDKAFPEAYRLRQFLSLLVTVLPGRVPQNSLMREFIGGSSFSYK